MNTISHPSYKQLSRFIWAYICKQPFTFFLIFSLSITWAVETTVWPYIFRQIIDTLTAYDLDRQNVWPSLKGLVYIAILFWIFIEFCFRTRDFLTAVALPKIEADIRMAMFDHVQHHSPSYFNEHFAGSLANKINDMTTHVTLILQNIMIFIGAIAASFLIVVFFSNVNLVFGFILGLWITLHFSICFFFVERCINYSNEHGEVRTQLAGKIIDSFTNNFAVNLFYRFAFEKQRIDVIQQIEQEKNCTTQRCTAYMLTGFSILFVFGVLPLFGFLIYYWSLNLITTGEIIQISTSTFNVIMILWIASFIMPQFFKSVGISLQALTVMNDPQDVIDTPEKKSLAIDKGEIKFEDVAFGYDNKMLFKGLNLTIRGGEKIGLVGYSGAGKTTFINLILKFLNVNCGRILIDGQDIDHFSLKSLRKHIVLIPQDPLLFHRSIEDNILYGKIDANFEEIKKAAQRGHADEFILRKPLGYQTMVGERGTKLSGGEKQRIAISRALLADAPILILDEATSALDSNTEHLIQDSLEKLMVNRTTIVIAHRLSTLSKMDRILVFDQGKIIEQGTHEELLQKKGHYAYLWLKQTAGFLPEIP